MSVTSKTGRVVGGMVACLFTISLLTNPASAQTPSKQQQQQIEKRKKEEEKKQKKLREQQEKALEKKLKEQEQAKLEREKKIAAENKKKEGQSKAEAEKKEKQLQNQQKKNAQQMETDAEKKQKQLQNLQKQNADKIKAEAEKEQQTKEQDKKLREENKKKANQTKKDAEKQQRLAQEQEKKFAEQQQQIAKETRKLRKEQQEHAENIYKQNLNLKEGEAIKRAYIYITMANAVYNGKRWNAMNHLTEAAKILDRKILENGTDGQKMLALQQDVEAYKIKFQRKFAGVVHEPQAVADMQMLVGYKILAEQVRPVLLQRGDQPRVLELVDSALGQIHQAFVYRATGR